MNAPVVLFTYKRPKHTQKVLEALMLCEGIENTEVFIFADGAKPNANQADKQAIEQTRVVLKTFEKTHKAKSMQITLSQENRGIAVSTTQVVSELLTVYETIIILEDDIVPTKGFLCFMNEALKKYEHQEQIWGASGYTFPLQQINKVKTNTFFLPINSSWGWGTWRSRWQQVNTDIHEIWNEFKQRAIKEESYNFGGYPYYQILKLMLEKKTDIWDAVFMASMFLQKGMFLYPKYSLVRNIGFDNTATHSIQEDAYFYNTPTVDYITLDTIPITLDNEGYRQVEKAFRQHFAPSRLQRIQNKLNPNSPYFLGKLLKK